MNHPPNADDRLRQLADSLDCIIEPDLCLLAKVTSSTAENWRKRGKGPSYILIGNSYLYPRSSLLQYLQSQVRTRSEPSVKGLL